MGPVIGIDVGQKRDPTTICVVEPRQRFSGTRTECHYLVRHLERIHLNTPYPEVARRIQAVVIGVNRQTGHYPVTYVDATGVGAPLLDLLRVEAGSLGQVIAVHFVHGMKRRVVHGSVRLGKGFFVNRLQALVQARRIHLPKTREADALSRELLNYEIRIDDQGRDRYGAFKAGTHDDLVTALGLAVQVDP